MKPRSRHILCATDYSDNAKSAADVAAAIALRLGTTLKLVHVGDEFHVHTERTRDFRAFLRDAKKELRQEAERLRQSGVNVEEVLLHGTWAEDALAQFLAKNPPALVVVSSVSKTTFDRWTIGSVSERISQRSPVPVLVVREPRRLLGWARQERTLNVLVAANFTVTSDVALSWVAELQKIGSCVVTVAHVYWPPEEQKWLPSGESVPLSRVSPVVHRRLLRDLRRKVAERCKGNVDVRIEGNWGRPDAAIVHLAAKADADLVVVGTHQRQGLSRLGNPSVSRGVLRHASMSVACVPVSADAGTGATHVPRIRRVLVATDTPEGNEAISWAYAALGGGGVVKIVHVVDPGESPRPHVPPYRPKKSTRGELQRRIAAARKKLEALAPSAAEAAGVTTEVEVIADRDPAKAIGTAARSFGPDMICVGSRDHSRIGEALLGSVTRTIIEENTQPVLVVRPEES